MFNNWKFIDTYVIIDEQTFHSSILAFLNKVQHNDSKIWEYVIYINYCLLSLPRISPTLHKSITFNHRHECLRLAKEKSELFILLQLNAISMGFQ